MRNGRINTSTFKASLAVAAALISGLLLAAVPAFADAGDLDRSFGKDGRVTTQLGNNDEAYAVVTQPDGKVVAAGISGGDFALVRYDRKGSLDETFGEDGKVFTDLGAREAANALVLQPDGKIVVAGYTRSGEEVGDFALARYNPDGSLDETFGGDGTLTTDLGRGNDEFCEADAANALVIQPDGKLVAAGVGCRDFALVRYDPEDGSLDETFGEDGVVTTNLDDDNGGGADSDIVYALALQPDGKLVAAGGRVTTGVDTFFYDTALARYNPDGSLDETFGEDGAVISDFSARGFEEASALVVQPDGRLGIAVGGPVVNDFILARFSPEGTLDGSFGGDGKVTTDFGVSSRANALVLQPDGRFVAAGTRSGRKGGQDFALVRYNQDGTPDRSFGRNGRVTTDFGGNKDAAFALALQPNGRLIAAGESTSSRPADSDFALARYDTSGRRER